MLHTLRKLKGSMIVTEDRQNIGEVKDFYFDDARWTIRYFVVNVGSWHEERLVLISPYHVKEIQWGGFNVVVNLTAEEIRGAPTPEDEAPVSRLYEEKYSRYYQLPFYWTAGQGLWPNNIYPSLYSGMMTKEQLEQEREMQEDVDKKIYGNHLRSFNEVMGYKIHAIDSVFGHVEDLVIDGESYQVLYLIIDTVNFLPSPSVIIPHAWVKTIDWTEGEIRIVKEKEVIKRAPHYDPLRPIGEGPELGGVP